MNNKLLEASEVGDLEEVMDLLSRGADLNTRQDFTYITPLMLAASKGHENIVHYLLTFQDIKINITNRFGSNALMSAARNGHLGVIKIFLADPRTNAHRVGKFGNTAMTDAAGFGQTEIVKELLKVENISLEATYTDKKYSPLTLARKNGHAEIVKILENFMVGKKITPPAPKPPSF